MGRRLPRYAALGAVVWLLCWLGFAATASAAPAFASPVDLSAGGQDAIHQHVAVDASGNALVVWERNNGTHDIIQSAFRPAGGSFAAPIDISPTDQRSTDPQVKFDASGNALAVWTSFNGTNRIVQSAFRPAGGAFATPVDLSATGQNASLPQVAFDASGDALAVWIRSDGTNNIVRSAFRPAGGAFAPAVDLSAAGQSAADPQVAFDASGNALAVWHRSDGSKDIVQSSFRPAGGAFPAAGSDLSASGQNAFQPQVAFDASGNALAVWIRSNGTNYIVQSSSRPAGGAFAAPVDLSAIGQDGLQPQVAFDASGNALAVWTRSDGTNDIVQSSSRPAGGAFPAAGSDVSASGQDASQPQVAFDASGNALVVWERSDGAHQIVQSSFRPAAGAFATPVDLSASGQDVQFAGAPQVAFDASGKAFVVWARFNGTNLIVQAAYAAHTLSVSTAGSGSGSVTGGAINCPGTCSHAYPEGTVVALTATPAAGSTFAGWSGGGCTGTAACSVTMSSDQAVSATFTTIPAHTLSVSTAGSGSGSVTGRDQLPWHLLACLSRGHGRRADGDAGRRIHLHRVVRRWL